MFEFHTMLNAIMNKLHFSFVLLLLLLVASPVFAQDELARDDEYLIRGLIRDGLYDVASDSLLQFVQAYPEHGKAPTLLREVAGKLYDLKDFPRLHQLSQLYYDRYFQNNAAGREMRYFLALSAARLGMFDEQQHLMREAVEDARLSLGRRLAVARSLGGLLLKNRELDTLRQMARGTPAFSKDSQIRLLLAHADRLQERWNEAETAYQQLIKVRDPVIKAGATLGLCRIYNQQSRFQETADIMAEAEDGLFLETGRSAAAKELEFIACLHVEQYERAFTIYRGSIRPPSQDDILITTYRALNEIQGVIRQIENRYLVCRDYERKQKLGARLETLYEEAGDRAALESLLKDQLVLADSRKKREIYRKLANASVVPAERRGYLVQALEHADQAKYRIPLLLALLEEEGKRGDTSSMLDIIARIEELRPEPAVFTRTQLIKSRILFQQGRHEECYSLIEDLNNWFYLTEEQQLTAMDRAMSAAWADGFPAPALSILRDFHCDLSVADFDDDTLRKVLEIGLAEVDESYLLRAGEELLARGLLTENDQLRWGSALIEADFPTGKAALATLLDSTGSSIAKQAARAILEKAIVSGYEEEFYQLAEELNSGTYGAGMEELGKLYLARGARLANDAVSFSRISREQIQTAEDEAIRREMISLYAETARESGNYQLALNLDGEFGSLEPTVIAAADRKLNAARRFFHLEMYQEVAEMYHANLREDSLSEDYRYMFAYALNERGNYEPALTLLEGIDPEALLPHWRTQRLRLLADGFFAGQQWEKAVELYNSYFDQTTFKARDINLHFKLGEAHNQLGQWREADVHFKKWLAEKADGEEEKLEYLAELYVQKGDKGGAIEILREIEELTEGVEERSKIRFRIVGLIEKERGALQAAEAYLGIAYEYREEAEIAGKARYMAAEAYLAANERQLAINQFKIVAREFNRLEIGRQAAIRLVQLAGIDEDIEEEVLQ